MKDITVVIPVHEINESIEEFLTNSVQSINNQTVKPGKVCVVHADTKELNDFFNSWEKPTDLSLPIFYLSKRDNHRGDEDIADRQKAGNLSEA